MYVVECGRVNKGFPLVSSELIGSYRVSSRNQISKIRKSENLSNQRAMAAYKEYEIRKRNPNPKVAALLVIDVQNYFSAMASPILPNLLATIRLCRRASIPVIFTRHSHKSPSDYGMLAEWWNGNLIFDGTPESQLMPELDPHGQEDHVVDKNTYSAFLGTRLEEYLKERGVEEVIVTGVMTNLCCETTAREAFGRGFRVFFSTDATATSDEELHQATLKNLAYGFAYLIDCNTLEQGLAADSAISSILPNSNVS